MTIAIHDTPLSSEGVLRIGKRLAGVKPFARELESACLAFGDAQHNLEKLASGEALCVTSGQQPGLFLGPAFSVYKALSAIALAQRLTEILERSVVPVFWVAGDDHDFAEANHVNILDRDHDVRTVQLPQRGEGAHSLPLYREVLGDEIIEAGNSFADALPRTDFIDDVRSWLGKYYAPGNTMATAFAQSLAELLGDRGLVVFQPTHEAAKRVQAPWILEAIKQSESLDDALRTKAKELARDNQPVPVSLHEGDTLVMVEGSLGRDRLRFDNGEFVTRRSGERWSLKELTELIHETPTRFSANVLLRPAVEAAILPTLAYVGGPGELAYIPQAIPVYEKLGVVRQPYVPRWSGVIVEPKVRRVLEKYDLSVQDLREPDGQVESRLAGELMPSKLRDGLDGLGRTLEGLSKTVGAEAVQIDPTLQKPVEGAFRQMASNLDHLEKRITARIKAKNEIVVRQIGDARTSVFPRQKPQERMFGFVQYLVRYGPLLLEYLSDACRRWVENVEIHSVEK